MQTKITKSVLHTILLAALLPAFLPLSAYGQFAPEPVDAEMVAKMKSEAMDSSQIMQTISYLTDVHGPRLTGSPLAEKAADWTVEQLNQWQLDNVHLESWGPFGRGWTLEGCTVSMVAPRFAPLIAHVKAWSPSTTRTIRGVPIYIDVKTAEDLEKYRGKLGRAIVLIGAPRELKALFDPPAERQKDETLLRLANAQPPVPRSSRSSSQRPSRATTTESKEAEATATTKDAEKEDSEKEAAKPTQDSKESTDESNSEKEPAEAKASETASQQDKNEKSEADSEPKSEKAEPEKAEPEKAAPAAPEDERARFRREMQLRADIWEMAYREGAAAILEPGRGDGGNVFVASVTMPRKSDDAGEEGNRNSRGPRPWATQSTDIIPQAVMAAEHYNQLVRMLQLGFEPELEVDILTRFYNDPEAMTFNIIAEIPGTDLKDEIVMLGAHFDSWQAGTGATDNAVGCGVAMEAIRILKAIDAKPRRTVRLALWTGEEQGLLGSRAYVAEHFGKAVYGEDRSRDVKYEIKPEQEKISAYYNLDNGTGAIRGIYLQGNEQLRPIFRSWLAPFAEMGASTVTVANTGGTDHQSFDAVGIPGFQFIQDTVEYNTRTHHSSMDVFDRIQEDDVKQASLIMATFVYQTAMRDELIPRKPLRGEVIKVEQHPTEVEPEASQLSQQE